MLNIHFLYLLSSVCFILALQGFSSFASAKRGLIFGVLGLLLSVLATCQLPIINSYLFVMLAIVIGGFIGVCVSLKIDMTKLPELMAGFHSLVGISAVFIAVASIYNEAHMVDQNIRDLSDALNAFLGRSAANSPKVVNVNISQLIELSLGAAIGAVTFTGSVIAFLKLSGRIKGNGFVFKKQNLINLMLLLVIISMIFVICINYNITIFWLIVILSFILGYFLVIKIGGADMPVVVSMLNSYSGWAACGIGFSLANPMLVIVGALVGSSGAILSYIMCKSMNRSIFNILWGESPNSNAQDKDNLAMTNKSYKSGNGDDAAFILSNASKVIIVPGYGMAVAQAQYVLKEMVDKLKLLNIEVKYAIHPVAGRMPGHMNVLLAEANIDYEEVFELETINSEFSTADVAYVIGANDVTNPGAKKDVNSPIYGMPILDVEKASTILFVKRSMGTGYSAVDNELFYKDNTMMLLGDAKKITEDIIKALEK